ncbi:MAG TPA: radical SAM protein [Acidimicrobiales bacterium]|nr:radical SAM protein [Acidimicrobiales bacterium]
MTSRGTEPPDPPADPVGGAATGPGSSEDGEVGAPGRSPAPARVPDCPFDYLDDPFPGGRAGPVPVYAVFPVRTGPVLALGMLTAAARGHHDGALARWYEIRRQEEPVSFLADLARRDGPAVVLLSNYVWSLGADLDLARRARELCPNAVIVHGGPSTPKYPADVERFFADHEDLVDVVVRGEGEQTLVEVLAALGPTWPDPDLGRLAEVAGLSYRDPDTGTVVRTDDRDRIADLDTLPSPYLTGEFDHLPNEAWDVPSGLLGLIFESNRGCPYGCTFCDWGSSTLSRIRKFSLERVDAEMRWAAERGLHAWMITDANFGIIARDVEIAERMARLARELGTPTHFGFNVAKNTTRHLTEILDRLVNAGIVSHFSLAMQTRDEATLAAVERTNISVAHYLALASAFRRRRLPLDADLMVGLPGQTLDSFTADLQFCIDHEIPARMWITELLPNAPMNDPAYRERWAIETDDEGVVVATATFSRDDRRMMMRLRHAYTAFERFGIPRHVLRYVQGAHGVPAMTVMRRIVALSEEDPGRYPLLDWVSRWFDHFNVAPFGWQAFFAEVASFLEHEFSIGHSSDRDAVLAAQAFLLPDHGRSFPASLPLEHDVTTWSRAHTRRLWGDGVTGDAHPLAAYDPGVLTVYGDPAGSCVSGIAVHQDPRNEVLTERFWISGHWELDSPLVANVSEVAAARARFRGLDEGVPADLRPEHEIEAQARPATPVLLRPVTADSATA